MVKDGYMILEERENLKRATYLSNQKNGCSFCRGDILLLLWNQWRLFMEKSKHLGMTKVNCLCCIDLWFLCLRHIIKDQKKKKELCAIEFTNMINCFLVTVFVKRSTIVLEFGKYLSLNDLCLIVLYMYQYLHVWLPVYSVIFDLRY